MDFFLYKSSAYKEGPTGLLQRGIYTCQASFRSMQKREKKKMITKRNDLIARKSKFIL